jgi:hypothetical protein
MDSIGGVHFLPSNYASSFATSLVGSGYPVMNTADPIASVSSLQGGGDEASPSLFAQVCPLFHFSACRLQAHDPVLTTF